MSHVTVSGVWEGKEKVTPVGVSETGKRCHHGCDGCNICIDAAILTR